MHSTPYTVRHMVDLAALLAQRGVPAALRGPFRPSTLPTYWAASQCRIEHWSRFLGAVAAQGSAKPSIIPPKKCLPWIDEVLASEMVTRLWTALAAAHDRRYGGHEFEPVARRVFFNQLEVRRRLLRLLVEGRCLDAATITCVDQSRRRVERWTDLLLGYVMPVGDVAEFAFDPQRAQDHFAALQSPDVPDYGRRIWPLVRASLRSSFRPNHPARLPHARLNWRIERSLRAACRAADKRPRKWQQDHWLARMEHNGERAERLIRRLLVG